MTHAFSPSIVKLQQKSFKITNIFNLRNQSFENVVFLNSNF